jgi:hypothetical protein
MSNTIDRVLCLPAYEVNALSEGKLICTLPEVQIQQGLSFLLYPVQQEYSPVGSIYRSTALSTASIAEPSRAITSWATCEYSTILHEETQIPALATLTIWTEQFLKEVFRKRQCLFLSYLRIRKLTKEIITTEAALPDKIGKFVGFTVLSPNQTAPNPKEQSTYVISKSNFTQRCQQLTEFRPSQYPRIETLYEIINNSASAKIDANILVQDLSNFLGWSNPNNPLRTTAQWINEIITSGNSSDGNLFEKRVRQSFVYLGFTNTLNNIKASLDPDSTGGAGGIDIYCEKPFPITGECKASEQGKVPGGVASQLNTLGQNHLGKDRYDTSVKIIFAAGELTSPDKNAVIQHKMNVMLPETLQRLVKLKSTHPGSINLRDLETCLRSEPFGESSDQKINNFIDRSESQIKLRANVAHLVKSCQEKLRTESVECSAVHTAYALSDHEQSLEQAEILEILIELSSPLAGYLGRLQGTDRFYFLRELPID